MRKPIFTSVRLAIAAGATLTVAACGGGESTDNVANDLGSNMILDEPANDASAMEMAVNTVEPLPEDNMANMAEDPETSGGDTGGNSLESNVTGM